MSASSTNAPGTNKIQDPQGAFPGAVSKPSLSEPAPSTRHDLPPNQDASLAAAEKDPAGTSNPVKMGSGSVAKGTSSVGKEGEHGYGEIGGRDQDADSKGTGGMGDKIKETIDKIKK